MTKRSKKEASEAASMLGKRSAQNMTPEERKERARKAAAKRWAKEKGGKKPPSGEH